MAKRTSSPLSSLSIADLNREVARRRKAIPGLQRRLAKAQAKVDRLRQEIVALGGGGAGGAGSGKGRRMRTGVVNSGTLADYLKRVLTGTTMGVTEVSEAVKAAGYQTDSPNFRTIVNAALTAKKNGFKKVSRGKYTV